MTTLDPADRPAIEAAGAECVIGDPDRVGTLRYALDNVTILMWLLGDDAREPLHGSRWKMMLERTIDTTVRGVLYERGTDNIPPERWQARLTSRELKVKPKSANIAGLQLADLIAHPSRREVLIEHRLIVDDRHTFGDQICAILRQSKYHRNWRTGQIEGYGKKLLP